MKIFIVFLGLLLVNVSVMGYKSDMGKFMYIQKALADIAFECVEAAADGREAQPLADSMLEHMIKGLNGVKVRSYACEISFGSGTPVVCVSMEVERLFRFPFEAVTSVSARKSL